MLKKRFQRAITIFKALKYGGWSWWIKTGKHSWHTILADRKAYKLKGCKLFLQKVKVAWLLSSFYLLNDDGVYSILKEEKNKIELYRINYSRKGVEK